MSPVQFPIDEPTLPLARAWHSESPYKHLPFSEKKSLSQVVATLSRKERGAAFFVVREGEAIGVMDLAVGEAWLSEGGCYSTCLAWFIHPRIRRSLLGGRAASMLLTRARVGQSPAAPRSSSSTGRTARTLVLRAAAWRG